MSACAFDTHSHIQDGRLRDEFDAIVARAAAADVCGIALCGYDAPTNEAALELAARSPMVFPTVGFHPHEADQVTPAMLEELDSLVALPEVVAVGELGLDFFRGLSEGRNQRRVLDGQLEIALRHRKPVCVHTRGAEEAAYDQLAPFAAAAQAAGMEVPGVMHCFGGTLEQAEPYVGLGFLVSIAAPITYPKNDVTRKLAAGLARGSLVIETDSPYLPPQTMRGKLNEPAQIMQTARAVAAARGETLEQVLTSTTANASRLFGVPAGARAGAA